MNDIIITTTNSIDGAPVEKYLGIVTSNMVIGTGLFSDFKASFSDFFGGMSGSYRKQMDRLYYEACNAISLKAKALGANCILGFRIDFDEISGKGTSMFMISVSGTAVKIKGSNESRGNLLNGYITVETLNIEYFKHKWNQRDKNKFPNQEEWNFILQYNLTDLAPTLYDLYARVFQEQLSQIEVDTVNNFRQLLSNMNYEEATEVIYFDYESRHKIAIKLINDNRLFCPEKVLSLMKKGYPDLAADLLETEKSEYTAKDIETMAEIVKSFDNLPDKGSIQSVKSGILSSKTEEKYICPNGHKNNKERLYCDEYDCGLNIKGLTYSQVQKLEKFKTRLSILQNLLNSML